MKQEKLFMIGLIWASLLFETKFSIAQQEVALVSTKEKKEIVFPIRERILTKAQKEKIAQEDKQKKLRDFVIEAEKTVYTFNDVDIAPKFNDIKFETFEQFISASANTNIPSELDAPSGVYKVEVNFVVMKDGSINFIRPITNFKYNMEDEAIRILKKSNNKWTPASRDGIAVMCEKRMVLTFTIL
jgi:hypothetical protein